MIRRERLECSVLAEVVPPAIRKIRKQQEAQGATDHADGTQASLRTEKLRSRRGRRDRRNNTNPNNINQQQTSSGNPVTGTMPSLSLKEFNQTAECITLQTHPVPQRVAAVRTAAVRLADIPRSRH